jgi:hypothetical protein
MGKDSLNINYEEAIPFWKHNKSGKLDIEEKLIIKYLEKAGFAKYYPSPGKTIHPLFVMKKQTIIEEINPIRIHEHMIMHLESDDIPETFLPKDVKDAIISELIKSKILEREDVLIILPELDKPILSDTSDSAFFPFTNAVINVTADNIASISYEVMDKYVWSKHVIKRDFKPCPMGMITDISDYYKFLRNVSSTWNGSEWEYSEERYKALLSLHGYLLHSYKDKSNPRAVVLMDASDNGEPCGRTGKGLIVDGLSRLRKREREDGKTYKNSERFRFSNVTVDTSILFIDDVPSDFDFESLFSLTTEGIAVEEKFKNKLYIPFETSPKIVISTNYALKGRGSSHIARKFEFELSNYYSDTHEPINDFKHLLFEGWNSEQWLAFDSLMIYAVQDYLKNGVSVSKPINIDRKKLLNETSSNFVAWINANPLRVNERYDKGKLYSDYSGFCEYAPDGNRRQFIQWVKAYAIYRKLSYEEHHNDTFRYIVFRPK